MNERNLSRRLSISVVEALKAHGHILVVKGGATALARELDDLMAPEIATVEPRLKPYTPLVGEPTSTFGDETIDQAVEDMVLSLTQALMNSDHVEDVFAEDAVIRRDIFRVVRDGLREPHAVFAGDAGDDGDQTSITVKLDTLGYVAATASRRTDASTLRQALDRAASVAGAHFAGWSPEQREATFRLEGGGLDERLEIEEAVADELTDLVEQGVVELPTIERRIDLGRALPAGEQRALRARIDAAADATLHRSGCPATWELEGPRTLRILFTPLSEQDAHGVDAPTSAFAREIAALLGSSAPAQAARAESPARVAAPPPTPKAPARAVASVASAPSPAAPPTPKAPAPPTPKPAARAVAPAPTPPTPKLASAAPPTPKPTPASAAPPPKAKRASKAVGTAAKPAARKRAGEASKAAPPKASAPRSTGKQAAAPAKTTKAPSKKR